MSLDQLDKAPWGKLTQRLRQSDRCPRLIRGLVSKDAPERKTALRELFGNIWHQGTVYEATIHALPSCSTCYAIHSLQPVKGSPR
jgi:hypothetical protein